MNTISIAVVEDHEHYRKAMVRLLAQKPELLCVGIFGSAEEALDVIPSLFKPDIILMDINLPGISGVDAVKILRNTAPEIEIMMLTIFEDNEYVFQALTAGATGYVVKTSPPEEVYESIIELYHGGSPMSDGIARKVLRFFQTSPLLKQSSPLLKQTPPAMPNAEEYKLTQREQEILQYLIRGYRYKEIADAVFLSTETVRKHIHNIYRKLEVHTRAEAMIKLRG
ncbi:MAG: response regulator transcription factor [Candidatus Kapaibacteriota bacterium]|jgi:DNA-binding NarL/FixJ family response regulator